MQVNLWTYPFARRLLVRTSTTCIPDTDRHEVTDTYHMSVVPGIILPAFVSTRFRPNGSYGSTVGKPNEISAVTFRGRFNSYVAGRPGGLVVTLECY